MQVKKQLMQFTLLGIAATASAQVTFTALGGKTGYNKGTSNVNVWDEEW